MLYLLAASAVAKKSGGSAVSLPWLRADGLTVGGVVVVVAVFIVATAAFRMLQDRLTDWLSRDLGTGPVPRFLRYRNARRFALLQRQFDVRVDERLRIESPQLDRRDDRLAPVLNRLRQYPNDPRRVRATMLANVQAAAQDRIRDAYGLDVFLAWPRLSPLLGDRLRAWVSERERRLDVLIAVAVTSALTAVAAAVLFAVLEPVPALIAVALPALLSRVTYTGAVRSAAEHGEALRTAVDLHRFDLLTSLHLALPANVEEERHLFQKLMVFWSQGYVADLPYVHTAQARQVNAEVQQVVESVFLPPDPVNFRGTVSVALGIEADRGGPGRGKLLLLDADQRTWRVPVGEPLRLVIDVTTGTGEPPYGDEPRQPDEGEVASRRYRSTLPLEVRGGRTAEVVEMELDIDAPFLEVANPDTHMMCPVERAAVRFETTVEVTRVGRHDLRVSVYSSNRLVQVLAHELLAE